MAGKELDTALDLPIVEREHYEGAVEIARGRMGRILEAHDRRTGRQVALKELLDPTPALVERFEREARLTAGLQHPGIPAVYEVGRFPSGAPFYAMRLHRGRSLEAVVGEARTLEDRLALLPIVLAVSEAIAYAHGQRIIHRDLKPANVLVGDFGETVVLHWGLARKVNEPDGEPADERTDVHALGAILKQVLADPAAPAELLALAAKAMAPDPAQRHRSGREFSGELRRYLTGRLAAARRPRAWVAAASALSLVAAGLAVAGALLLGARDRARQGLEAAQAAEARAAREADDAILANARAALDRDPAAALAWLLRLSHRPEAWERARVVALDARGRGIPRSLRGHGQAIERVLPIGDGARLVAATEDELWVWDVSAGAGRRLVDARLAGWAASQDGGRIVARVGEDVRVFDVESGAARPLQRAAGTLTFDENDAPIDLQVDEQGLRTIDLTSGAIRSLVPSLGGGAARVRFGDRVVTAHGPGASIAIRMETGERTRLERPAGVELDDTVEGQGGRALAARATSGELYVWELPSGRRRPQRVRAADLLAVSPDASWVVYTNDAGDTLVAHTGLGPTRVIEGIVTSVTFSEDGRLVALAGEDKELRVLALESGDTRVFRGSAAYHNDLAFLPDGTLAAGGYDRVVRLFAAQRGDVRVLRGHRGPVLDLIADAHGLLVSAAVDGVRRWNAAAEPATSHVLPTPDVPVAALAAFPDGALAGLSLDNTVRILDAEGAGWRVLFDRAAGALAVAPGARVAAGASDSPSLLLFASDAAKGESYPGHDVEALLVLADGRIVSGGRDGHLRVLDPEGKTVQDLAGHGGAVTHLAAAAATVASAGADGTVIVWDLARGVRRTLGEGQGRMGALALSPDGRRLAAAGVDRSLRVWDVASGAAASPGGHDDRINALAFSPDGSRLASASSDETVRLWYLDLGESRTLHGHSGPVTEVVWLGDLLASAGRDGVIRVWPDDLPSGEAALREWLAGRADATDLPVRGAPPAASP